MSQPAPSLNQEVKASATGVTHPPVKKIMETALLPLLRSKQVKLVTDVIKGKKGKGDLYSSEFRWADTNEPLLTSDGVVDCTATVIWGVPPPERRNTGEFGKPDGPFDDCELQFATKGSGTFGEYMCELNDSTYPQSVHEFTKRADQKEAYDGHDIDPHQFCKKFAGSLKNPAPPAEQAAYKAAADWSFSVHLKIQKYILDKKTNTRKLVPNALFMCKVVKYVLNAQGIPVEQEIKINSNNIHKELTRGSKILIAMRPGNGTMKAGIVKGQTINTFFPAWNFNHITVLKKGEFVATKVDRSPEEIRAALEAAGVTLTYTPEGQQDDDDDGTDPDAIVAADQAPAAATQPPSGSTQFKASSTGATGEDLAKQFANLGS